MNNFLIVNGIYHACISLLRLGCTDTQYNEGHLWNYTIAKELFHLSDCLRFLR